MARKTISNRQGKAKQGGKRGGRDAVKIIALLVFILIGWGIIGGSIWYYAIHEPKTSTAMESTAVNFTQDYFNVEHSTITGQEGMAWASAAFADRVSQTDRVETWKNREIVMSVQSDVEVSILQQGLRSGKTRAIFWQYEEEDGEEGKENLIFYDYDLVFEDGRWLIDKVTTADPEELAELRKSRGIEEEDEEDDEDEDEEDEEEIEENTQ